MSIVVISNQEAARAVKRAADAGRVPVVSDGRFLGAAGRAEAGALSLARGALNEDALTVRLTDIACLWIGDHPPRSARKLTVPGDKRPYAAVTAWVVERL